MSGRANVAYALALLCLLGAAVQPAVADTLRVGPSRTYTTIQSALDAASDDDTIIVDTGTYMENIVFPGCDLVLKSSDPLNPSIVAATVINGGGLGSSGRGNGPVVTFAGTETAYCVLEGFTITNGVSGVPHGGVAGGIRGRGTLAVIRYNVITNNQAGILTYTERIAGSGAGLLNCDGQILGNTISNNHAGEYNKDLGGVLGYGGALYGCDGPITNNTITGNYVIGYGGGLHSCQGELSGNTISGNSAVRVKEFFTTPMGGGLYNCNGPIHGNEISGNSSGYLGGGLYGCNGTISENTIENNSAHNCGGGLDNCQGCIEYNDLCQNFAGCTSPDCPAPGRGGAAHDCDNDIGYNYIAFNFVIRYETSLGYGGGLDQCDGFIVSNTFLCNTAEGFGGAVSRSFAPIEHNRIMNNTAIAKSGGGGALCQCNARIRKNIIVHNLSYDRNASGGGLRGCGGTIDRNTIAYNTADGPNARGGGLYNCNGTITNNMILRNVGSDGGGIAESTGTILNNTIAENQAVGPGSQGAGLYSCTSTIKNNIVWGNKAEVGAYQLSSCAFPTYSCIEGSNYGVASNITDPPVFRDPDHGDFRLDLSSPCIDAGALVSLSLDYDDETRPQNGTPTPRGDGSDYDMGADEWSSIVPEYTLLMKMIGSGTIDPEPGTHVYSERSIAIVSATPKVGWVFDRWNGVTPDFLNPAWIEMTENKTITAIFTPGEGWHRLNVSVIGDGTTDPEEGEHVFEMYSDVSLRASAAPGWYFDHWEGDASGSANPYEFTMDDDKDITAVFEPAQAGHRILTTAVVGGGTTDPPAGEHLCVPDSVMLVKATANSGWIFHHWEGHLSGSTNPATITMDANKSVTAVFVPIPDTRTLTTSVMGFGTIYPPAGTYQFVVDTVVDIQAAAGPGWRFDGWGGQVTDDSANPTTVIMDANKAATAVFVKKATEDINEDESITAVDVQLVINAALGFSIAPYNGDVDGDGSVTAIDVQRVINALLGLT